MEFGTQNIEFNDILNESIEKEIKIIKIFKKQL